MDKNKWTSILYFISSVLFFIASVIQKNYVFIPIGCCMLVLSVVNHKGDKEK